MTAIRPPAKAAAASEPEEWRAWMAAAQAGDQAAYRRLLAALLPYLRGFARRHLRDAAAAEDLVQDVLLTVHRIRHTYDPARPFLPWLATIARRRLVDQFRRHSRQPVAAEDIGFDLETYADDAANDQATQSVDAERLRQALGSLPDKQRRAVELLKLEEKSLKEVSVLTGMSVAALKTTTHRALKVLRLRLGGAGETARKS